MVDAAVTSMGGDASKVVDQLKIDAAAGSNKQVVLTGSVPLESIKTQRGQVAAQYFGPDYKIDNQIVVQAPAIPQPVSLYFDTGKTNLQADAGQLLAKIVAYGNASPNSKIQLTGFHDKRGSPAANVELAKNRAKSVAAYLKKSGLAEDRIVLVRPAESVGAADDKEARRVDVIIAQ